MTMNNFSRVIPSFLFPFYKSMTNMYIVDLEDGGCVESKIGQFKKRNFCLEFDFFQNKTPPSFLLQTK